MHLQSMSLILHVVMLDTISSEGDVYVDILNGVVCDGGECVVGQTYTVQLAGTRSVSPMR